MKKVTIFFILFVNFVYSQKSYEAIYNVEYIADTKTEESPIVKNYKNLAKKNSNKIKFILKGNDNLSSFSLKESLSNNERDVEITLSLIGYLNNPIYQDFDNALLLRNSPEKSRILKSNEFLIKSPLYEDWTLTNESKVIKNLKCFKAKGTTKNLDGGKPKPIIAWYCPSLNFNHGPLGYGNLSGLIIYLRIGEVIYTLDSIKLNKEELQINIPKKGKEINESEYVKILSERFRSYK